MAVAIAGINQNSSHKKPNTFSSTSTSRNSTSSKAPRVLKHKLSLPGAAMCAFLTPVVHLRVRARELLADTLMYEGVSESGRADADCLARQLWGNATADSLMRSVQEVLPPDTFRELLGFCRNEYPLLYSTLPGDITGDKPSVSWAQHGAAFMVENAVPPRLPQLMQQYMAGHQHSKEAEQ